ncbi:MAG TPA: hypothetical protein VEP73_07895, partial [Actinomycetota bacterium]|nr:hypothetical protein [Actinomycetota bacterium]
MRTTAARSTVGSSGAPTGPATPGRALFRTVLARELAATFLLLGVALAAGPARTGATPGSAPWGYQREAVDVAGRGPINAYARATIRATAWLARASIERQRDVGRLNLLQYLAGDPAARAVGAWRPGHRLALEGGTAAALLALVACGV